MDRYDLANESDRDLVQNIARRLNDGDVGIIPTETVYGIVCIAGNSQGEKRIYQIKHRDTAKKLQFLISRTTDITLFNISLSPQLERFANHFWPGPLTIVAVDENGERIGFRNPDHPFISAILAAIGKPLLATSANLSGNSPNKSASKHFRDLAQSPDFIVYGEPGCGTPSTVIQFADNKCTLLRAGAIPFKLIQDFIDHV